MVVDLGSADLLDQSTHRVRSSTFGTELISALYFFEPCAVSVKVMPPKYAPSTMPRVSWKTLATVSSWEV
ncbi:hypothetical protein [Lentzea xinjiangensis]|uniref:hypothetical protein n=1 Tax=Lentzea xinjiangensis TaxID=402600 RepID=UPI001160A80E|nr:hypothetical protein [Lentzea xinjiangensis]